MARVQGMTPEGIRKAIAEAISFIEDLNVEDLNKLLAAFEDANGIFDLRLVEVQEEVKKAGDKALEAEEQARLIVEELARHQELQAAESARILSEVAIAIQAANLASDRIPDLLQRMASAEESLAFANSEFSTLIIKQDEFLDTVAEQTAEISRLNSEFVAVNQTVGEAVDKVDQSTIKVNQIGGDLELARTTLDAKIKKSQEDISAAQKVADEHQNEIETLTGNLGGLTTEHTTLASNFSAEVKNLKEADSSQVESISSLAQNVNTKVGELRDITDAQAADITAAKNTATAAKTAADSAITNTVIQYAVGSSETVAPTTGWSPTTPTKTPGSYIWMRTIITYGSGNTTTTAPVPVTGNDGRVGDTGAPGRGVQTTTYHYTSSTSGTVIPTTGWVTTIPTVAPGSFLWTRKTERYTDGTQDLSYSTARQGINGAKGDPGTKGLNGLTSYLHVAYANNETGTSGFSVSDPTDRLYVGTYTDFIEADSTDPSKYTWQLVKGADGEDGNGVLSSTVSYQSSTSATAQPTGTWLATIPTVAAGSFLWTRTTTIFKDGSETTAFSVARQGSNGAAGLSVTSVTPYFQLVLRGVTPPAKPTTATPSGWVTKEPDWVSGRELYRTEKVLYSNGTFSYTEVSKVSSYTAADKGISDAAAATQALETYKTDNNVKVQKALGDAAKGISDAAAANSIATGAVNQLPAMNTAISSAAAEAKKANDALPAIRTDISNVSTRISTATGNLTALESDVASKVAALQATDQAQAGEITAAKKEASDALNTYKGVNDPKVTKAQTDATKAIADAKTAADKLPAMNTAISSAAAEAKKANDALPKIRTDISGLTTSIGTTTGNLTSLQTDVNSKVAALQATDQAQAGEISAAKSQAAQGISDAAAAKAAVDNLQIGGRNLLQNSKLDITSSAYNISISKYGQNLKLPKDTPLVDGEEVTVSLKGKLGEGKSYFALYNSGGTYSLVSFTEAHRGSDGVYRRVTKWVGAEQTSNDYIYVYHMPSNVIVESTVEWIKIERGNKATDWTPAPEDVDAGIKTALDEAKAATGALPAINTSLSDASSKANQAVAALPGLSSGVTAAQNKADSVELGLKNLQIGGRNLAPGTGNVDKKAGQQITISTWGSHLQTGAYSDDLPPGINIGKSEHRIATEQGTGGGYTQSGTFTLVAGQTYTISFWGKCSEVWENTYNYLMSVNRTDNKYLAIAKHSLTTEWQRYSETFTIPEGLSGTYRIRSILYQAKEIWLSHPKLEVGNKATDWTPAPEDIQSQVDGLNTKAEELTTGLSNAATQEQYNALNTRLWGNQGEINTINANFQTQQNQINANNTAFQTWQTDINTKRGKWEDGATLALQHLTDFTTQQTKWNKASTDATNALTNAAAAQKAFNDNQLKWNTASTNATKALNDLTTEQGKVLALQTELNTKRDKWESGATLAIDNLTNFSVRQDKWNKASTDATNALTNAAAAQKAFNDNQLKWNTASTNATKALADLTTEQGKVLALQTELNTKRDKWESGATLAIDNLTNFSVRQDKWNKASTDATKALSDSSKAQLDATKAITQILNMVYPNNSLVSLDPNTNLPMWAKYYSKNTDGNWLVTGAAKSFPSSATPHVAVQTGQIYRAIVRLRASTGTPAFSIRLRTRGSETSITPTYVAIPTAEVPTGMVVKNWLGTSNLATSTTWQEWVCDFRLPDNIENVRIGYVYSTTSAVAEVSRLEIFPLLPSQKQIDDIQNKTIESHTALFAGQNKWNEVATAAIESQATLLAKQARWSDGVDKALAWQDQLNNSQSDINKTTTAVLANQAKWNSAQLKVNDSQSEINQATQSVLLNQSKWNTAQEKVNNDQSDLNKAMKTVQDKQLDWNNGVTKALAAHDELFVSTSTTFKAVKAVQDNQTKWNKVVSDLVTTNSNVSAANKTAIEGLNRVLGLRYSSSNVIPMVPGGVRTGGTDLAPVFTPTPGWMTKGTRVTVTDIPGITSIDAIQQTGQATHTFTPYYSEIDPTIEYKYSYWAKADVASTRIYIELRSGESTSFPVESNTQDNHSSAGQYLAGNVLLAVGWKQYTGTIRFKPETRTIYVNRIYYSHPNGVSGTQTIADIQIYPNIPSQADVNKALTDSDAAQNTLLAKQELWNEASSRSIATVENLWGKTSEEVGFLNTLTDELGEQISQQAKDFAKNISQLFTFIPRIAYAQDGQDVPASETDGFIKITRTKSGSQTTKVAVEAVGNWVGSLIIEGDHGKSDGQDRTFMNYTPIRIKRDVISGTRIFNLWRSTSVDHIGAVKVTFFVAPGEVQAVYPSGTNSYPDPGLWRVLTSDPAPETSDYNISLNVTWAATTYGDKYGIRIRSGTTVVAEILKDKVGPLLPGESGVRTMNLNKTVKVYAGRTISLEAYSNASQSPQRRISKWNGQISYITSGRG